MHHILARRLLLNGATNPVEHSPAIRIEGRTYVRAEVKMLAVNGTPTVTVAIEQSDDLEHWFDCGIDAATLTTAPSIDRTGSGIAAPVTAQHLRLRYAITGDNGPALLASVLDVMPS